MIEPQYHVAHILVTTSPGQVRNLKNSKAQNEADARKKMMEILNRLDSGEDFASVAMNWSEDPDTASNGGDLGNIPESALKSTGSGNGYAVLRLKAGQHTPIIPVIALPGPRVSRCEVDR